MTGTERVISDYSVFFVLKWAFSTFQMPMAHKDTLHIELPDKIQDAQLNLNFLVIF